MATNAEPARDGRGAVTTTVDRPETAEAAPPPAGGDDQLGPPAGGDDQLGPPAGEDRLPPSAEPGGATAAGAESVARRVGAVALEHLRHDPILGAAGRLLHDDEGWAGPPYAALWRRAAAWALDVGLFGGATFGVVVLTGARRPIELAWRVMWYGLGSISPHSLHELLHGGLIVSLVVLIAGFLSWVAYRVVCIGWSGRTIGKLLLGIQVVRAEDPLAPPGFRRAAVRWAVPPLSSVIPLPGTGLLPYLFAVRDRRRQGGHDKAAKTIVVRRRMGGPTEDSARPDPPT